MADTTFFLRVLSPERTFYEGEVTMLELTTSEGDMGILPGHIPTTCVLAPGVMNIYEKNETTDKPQKKVAALHSGFIEIMPDSVNVIAEAVEWPDEIDINRATIARQRAERRLKRYGANMNVVRTELALKRALVRLSVSNADKEK